MITKNSADILKNNLLYHRKTIKLKQKQLADQIGICDRHYQNLEKGIVNLQEVKVKSVMKLSAYFNAPFQTLTRYKRWIIKHNLGYTVATLEDFPIILENLLHHIPEEKLPGPEKEDDMSIHDYLLRLIDEQQMFLNQLKSFKRRENPVFNQKPQFKKSNKLTRAIPAARELVLKIKEWRLKQLDLLAQLDDRDFEKNGVHHRYGCYPLSAALKCMISRDFYYYNIINELLLIKK